MPVIGHGADICTSTTRPASPSTGAIIFETDTMSYRWYTGTAWEGIIPVGTTQSFAGATAPTGWLLCFGQSLNATTNPQYAALWSVLGTTYGGSGITAFNVPDLRGRAPHGKDDMGGSAASRVTSGNSGITGSTLGAVGGDERLHAHNHTQAAHTHRVLTSNRIDPNAIGFYYNSVDGWGFGSPGGSGGTAYYTTNDRQNAGSQLVENSTPTINNNGSGNSQNMPPTIITNYIIKY